MSKKIGLSDQGRQVLSTLRVGQEEGELARLGLDARAVRTLMLAGLLEEQGDTMQPSDYQETYSGWKSQKGMLIDDERTLGFERAIMAVVRSGDRVVDVGTGSGILAMIAARRGAGEVYALEVTGMPSGWPQRTACPTLWSCAAMRPISTPAPRPMC